MPMFDVATAYGLRKRSVALQRPVTKWPLIHAMITIKSGPDPQLTLRHACDYLNQAGLNQAGLNQAGLNQTAATQRRS
jgi:hypothetical protein